MAHGEAPDGSSEHAADRDRDGAHRETPDQPPNQPALPFEGTDDPVPYALTARARRTVAPGSLPELSVVPEQDGAAVPGPDGAVVPGPDGAVVPEPDGVGRPDRVDDPDPFDPRPARARALRRAGRDVSEIADLLDVDEELVTAWCRTVGPRAERRRARAAGGSVGTGGAQVRRLPLPEPDQHAPQRQRGHDQAAQHLTGGTREILAFVAGRAQVTAHSVTFRVVGPDQAARIVDWLVDLAAADPSRARLVLDVGPDVAHDLVEARWEQGTGISAEHIVVSRGAADDEVRATLRIAAPDVAAVLAGWQDAFMEASSPLGDDA